MAQRIHGPGLTKCPELTFHDDRWWCGAVERARGPYLDDVKLQLSIGAGCCCGLNTDRQNIPKPTPKQPAVDWKRAFQHLSVILGKQWVSGDMIFLIAMDLQNECGDDAADEFLALVLDNGDMLMPKTTETDTGYYAHDILVNKTGRRQ
jgi:hypothetical protein